jgi:hypothetical protein
MHRLPAQRRTDFFVCLLFSSCDLEYLCWRETLELKGKNLVTRWLIGDNAWS